MANALRAGRGIFASNVGRCAPNDDGGGVEWQAWYTYSATGHRVHNRVTASVVFENGLILRHNDAFNPVPLGASGPRCEGHPHGVGATGADGYSKAGRARTREIHAAQCSPGDIVPRPHGAAIGEEAFRDCRNAPVDVIRDNGECLETRDKGTLFNWFVRNEQDQVLALASLRRRLGSIGLLSGALCFGVALHAGIRPKRRVSRCGFRRFDHAAGAVLA